MMRLTHLKFTEFPGTVNEWRLEDVSFKDINLLVARNSTGKTRIINVIANLAKMLSGRMSGQKAVIRDYVFDAKFEDGTDKYHYTLEHDSFVVTSENLYKNDVEMLHRGAG